MFRRLLHRLSRRPAAAPGFGPLPAMPSNDAEDWLMKPHGGGTLHFPPLQRIERGAAGDAVLPVPQREPVQKARTGFRAAGNRADGTAGR